jgi:hypothetical protein
MIRWLLAWPAFGVAHMMVFTLVPTMREQYADRDRTADPSVKRIVNFIMTPIIIMMCVCIGAVAGPLCLVPMRWFRR